MLKLENVVKAVFKMAIIFTLALPTVNYAAKIDSTKDLLGTTGKEHKTKLDTLSGLTEGLDRVGEENRDGSERDEILGKIAKVKQALQEKRHNAMLNGKVKKARRLKGALKEIKKLENKLTKGAKKFGDDILKKAEQALADIKKGMPQVAASGKKLKKPKGKMCKIGDVAGLNSAGKALGEMTKAASDIQKDAKEQAEKDLKGKKKNLNKLFAGLLGGLENAMKGDKLWKKHFEDLAKKRGKKKRKSPEEIIAALDKDDDGTNENIEAELEAQRKGLDKALAKMEEKVGAEAMKIAKLAYDLVDKLRKASLRKMDVQEVVAKASAKLIKKIDKVAGKAAEIKDELVAAHGKVKGEFKKEEVAYKKEGKKAGKRAVAKGFNMNGVQWAKTEMKRIKNKKVFDTTPYEWQEPGNMGSAFASARQAAQSLAGASTAKQAMQFISLAMEGFVAGIDAYVNPLNDLGAKCSAMEVALDNSKKFKESMKEQAGGDQGDDGQGGPGANQMVGGPQGGGQFGPRAPGSGFRPGAGGGMGGGSSNHQLPPA